MTSPIGGVFIYRKESEMKKNMRVIVEIDDELQYSHFDKDGKNGGVAPLNIDMQKQVEAQLQMALLHVQDLLNHK